MFDRELLGQIQGYNQVMRDPARSRTGRLEAGVFRLITILSEELDDIEILQRFYERAEIAALIQAAGATEPLEPDGTLTKRSLTQLLSVVASLRAWSTTPIAGLGGNKTPLQILAQQPEKVAAA